MDENEDDDLLRNLTKEIEELRAKRLSHDLYKKNTLEDDDSDDFETAIFAETLLGELGSSSGSHKDAEENDDQEILDGDSGASDRGSRSKSSSQLQPLVQVSQLSEEQKTSDAV